MSEAGGHVRRTVVKDEVRSRFLPEGERAVRVYLPPGYQEWLSYPVVYCQDGEDFFNFGRIATFAQRLILEEDWEPFVIVGVDVDKAKRTAEYAPDGERHSAYVRFFGEELIPAMESRYAVRRAPGERVLAGDSLGAAASLSVALAYPDRCRRILSLSGAFYGSSQTMLRQAGELSGLAVWMTVGLGETAFESELGTFDIVALNRTARTLLERKGARVLYSERPGEHKWGFWQSVLPEALAAFLGPNAEL
jgi:enterochelin esterase-like enzyme